MEAGGLERSKSSFPDNEFTASLVNMRPCLRGKGRAGQSVGFGALGQVVAVVILFESGKSSHPQLSILLCLELTSPRQLWLRTKAQVCAVWGLASPSCRSQDPAPVPGTDAEAEDVWATTAGIQGAELFFSEKGACDDAQRAVWHPWSSGSLWVHGDPMGNRSQLAGTLISEAVCPYL